MEEECVNPCPFCAGRGQYNSHPLNIFQCDKCGNLYPPPDGDFILKHQDSCVEGVLDKYRKRSDAGMKKYGTTLDRDDINLVGWLTHLQEELMDAVLYIERTMKDVSK